MSSYTLITGASDGIGRAMAMQLGAKGESLILVARRERQLNQLKAEIEGSGNADVQVLALDLATEEGTHQLIENLSKLKISTAVLAAGFGSSVPFEFENRVGQMIDLNCKSVAVTARHLIAKMSSAKEGNLVMFSSVVGFQGTANSALYAATKNFVHSLTEGLRIEAAKAGVKTLLVAPGPVKTGFASTAGMSEKGADVTMVAASIIKNIGKSKNLYPGIQAQVLVRSLAIAPRGLRVRLLSQIMKGMAAH